MLKKAFSPTQKTSKLKLNEYKETFDIIDKDRKGLIPTSDLIRIFNTFCLPISRRNIQRMIKEIKTPKDGKFNFNNFVTLMEKQNEYLDENSEDMVIESFKDEYLGNKIKRDNSSSDEDELLVLNYDNENENDNNIPEENKKASDEVFMKLEDSTHKEIPNIEWNSKKKSNENNKDKDYNFNIKNAFSEKIPKKTRRNKQTKFINYLDEDENISEKIDENIDDDSDDEYSNNKKRKYRKKNKEKEKKKEIKKKNEKTKQEKKKKGKIKEEKLRKENKVEEENKFVPNTIIINKKNLPIDLVKKIELSKNTSLVPIFSQNIGTPKKEDKLNQRKVFSNFSSKFVSDIDFNNISNIKPGSECYSFASSEFSLDFLNKLNIQNSNNKSPMSSVKLIKCLNNMTPDKNLNENNEQSEKKILNEKMNMINNNNEFELKNNEINNVFKTENKNNQLELKNNEINNSFKAENKNNYNKPNPNNNDLDLENNEINNMFNSDNNNKNNSLINDANPNNNDLDLKMNEINNILNSENNNNKNKNYLEEQNNNIIIVYRKNKDEYYFKDDKNYISLKENKIKQEQINKDEQINKIEKQINNKKCKEKKHLNSNFKIINTLELRYKKNKRGEKIITKSREIPYLIILDKKGLNLDEIKLNFNKNNFKNENKKNIFVEPSNKLKKEKITSNINHIKQKEKTEKKELSIKKDLKRKMNPQKPKEKKLMKKNESKLLKEQCNEEKKEEKIIEKKKYDKKKFDFESRNENEFNKFLNIAQIMSNSSVENDSKDVQNEILQEKTVNDDDNFGHKTSKNNNNRNNTKDNEVELTTTEFLRGFNYLYHQKID